MIDILTGNELFETSVSTIKLHFSFDLSDDSPEGILARSMTTGCTPIPKIAIQEEKDDFFRKEFGKVYKEGMSL